MLKAVWGMMVVARDPGSCVNIELHMTVMDTLQTLDRRTPDFAMRDQLTPMDEIS